MIADQYWCELPEGALHSGIARAPEAARGSIESQASGSLGVGVYAGLDPLTGQRNFLREMVPGGPGAQAEAERVLRRLLGQVDERRNPRTKATVNQLLDRYLEVLDVDQSTRTAYEGYIERHIRPVLGDLQAGRWTTRRWTASTPSYAAVGVDAAEADDV
jgi:integrase